MSHTDMGIVGATTDTFILFENGVRRNRAQVNLVPADHGLLHIALAAIRHLLAFAHPSSQNFKQPGR
jgi:hypothetical protein